MYENSRVHTIGIFLITLVCINLFILDLAVFSSRSPILLSDVQTAVTSTTMPSSQSIICDDTCKETIKQEVIQALEELPTQTPVYQNTAQSSISREYYIPLGSGSTTKSSWEDLATTETLIDPALYGTIREAYFIASLKNPTQNGQVEAQLYNVTDKHPVWGSHVVMNGPASQTITSGKITLDTGSKLYRVQLKSTLGYSISLENGKIRIVTE